MKQFAFILAVATISFYSCKKDKKDPEPTQETPSTGSVKLEFENTVDGSPLVFGTKYKNANGDTFSVSKFNYYISNIVLTKSDNSTYAEPNSYHLLRHSSPSSLNLTLNSVPNGSYKSVSFILGVDSTHNCSGVQEGDLNPTISTDMYWSWSSGYIMLKLEGTAPNSGATNKIIEYHIGGYGGVNKTQRSFNFNFGSSSADVNSSSIPAVRLGVNANELFTSPTNINFATQYSQVSPGANAKIYADNYSDMITFKYIH